MGDIVFFSTRNSPAINRCCCYHETYRRTSWVMRVCVSRGPFRVGGRWTHETINQRSSKVGAVFKKKESRTSWVVGFMNKKQLYKQLTLFSRTNKVEHAALGFEFRFCGRWAHETINQRTNKLTLFKKKKKVSQNTRGQGLWTRNNTAINWRYFSRTNEVEHQS